MTLLKVASRNLRRNRRRTTITLVALVVGVVVLVGLRGFINGQQRVLVENLIQGRLGAVQVHRAGYVKNVLSSPLTLDMADDPGFRARLARVPHVTAVAPRIEFGAMVSTPDKRPPPDDGSPLPEADQGKTSFFIATAVDPALEAKVTPRRTELVTVGHMFPDAQASQVVLNAEFASGLEAPLLDPARPLPPVEQQTALLAGDRDGALNGENVMLSGTLPSFSPGDKRNGLVPLGLAQKLLRMEGRVTEYALAVEPLEAAPTVRAALQAELGPDYEVHTWDELFPFIKSLTGTQDFVFSIVSGVFLAVVLLGVVNAMLMTVLERTREIGTMLAVGMRRRQIVTLFILEGLVIGTIGASLGVVLGSLLTLYLNHQGIPLPSPGATVPSIVRPFITARFLLAALVGAPVGAALATLWPALRAAALRPVEALQSP
ncbi:MAG: FtsX-like permease family protein [Myxococcaceae bacterium]|nr:FtsX-like permease family protein [Myxococcaceae bacterium]